MSKQKTVIRRVYALPLRKCVLATISALVASPLAIAQSSTPADSKRGSNTSEEVVILSPFVVSAAKDQGYTAQNTLMGTRLNTSINDLGVTLTTVTEQFWQDLSVSSVNDLIDFTPGASKEVLQVNLGSASALYWGDNTIFRGVHTENIVRNGFRTNLPSDTYNASRFEFSRGPNAILFGTTGDPMGLVNRTVKDATFADQYELSLRVTDLGGFRQSIDLNKVLLKDKLAVRLDLLNDKDEYFLQPTFQDQKRIYGAVTFKPSKQLTLKADAEYMDWLRAAPNYALPFDGVTPYLNAATSQGKTPAQIGVPHNVYSWASGPTFVPYFQGLAYPTMVVFDSATSPTSLPNWHSKPIGPNINVLGSNNVSVPVGLVPQDFNTNGNSQMQQFRGYNAQIYAQYEVTRDFQLELAVNQEHMLYNFFANWGADTLHIDAASTLPDGVTPNPNVGRYFVVNDINWNFNQIRNLANKRLTASYHLESARKGWPAWMGNHDFAFLLERASDEEIWTEKHLVNMTPPARPSWMDGLSGALPAGTVWSNGWDFSNIVRVVNYVDLKTKTIYGVNNVLDFQKAANAIPGVNAQWIPTSGPLGSSNIKTQFDSALFVWQSRFWHDRIIPTLGFRRDYLSEWKNLPIGQDPSKPLGVAVEAKKVARVKDTQISALNPDSYSRGLVVHAYRGNGLLSYVSPTVNQSNSVSLSSFTITPDGTQTGLKKGKTTDYGFHFGLMDNKVNGTFTMFKTTVTNDPSVTSIATGDLAALMVFIGHSEFGNIPVSQVKETQDVVSKGWELQFTSNITRNWRASVSYSHYATELANIAPTTGRLIKQYRSEWMANPNALIGTGAGARTVAVVDNLVTNSYLIAKAQEGARTMNERRNKFTFVSNYDFTDGLFKGFSVGANAIWEDKASTGYALRQVAGSWVPDAGHPFFNGDLLRLGASVSYSHKLFHDKIPWRIQLNIYNIGGIDPYIVRASAASTAPTTMVPTYMNRGTPQGWSLTSTFNF